MSYAEQLNRAHDAARRQMEEATMSHPYWQTPEGLAELEAAEQALQREEAMREARERLAIFANNTGRTGDGVLRADIRQLLDENARLAESACQAAANEVNAHAGKLLELMDSATTIEKLSAENARLKRGDFTPEEELERAHQITQESYSTIQRLRAELEQARAAREQAERREKIREQDWSDIASELEQAHAACAIAFRDGIELAKYEWRKRRLGECRMLSEGHECRCFLCTLDSAALARAALAKGAAKETT